MMALPDVATLLADRTCGWVPRGLAGPTSRQLSKASDAAGWRFLQADVSSAGSKDELMDVLATSWQLPDYFGRNWDALADCLADLDSEKPGIVLRLKGLHGLAPELSEPLTQILTDRAQDGQEGSLPAFLIVTDPPVPATA